MGVKPTLKLPFPFFFFSLFIYFLNLNLFILIGGYEKVGKAWLLSSVAFCDFGFELGSA